MTQETRPENIIKTLEGIARECIQANANLRKPLDGTGEYRCYSMALEHRFCPYQGEAKRDIEKTDKLPGIKMVDYYRCTYDGGD